MGLAHEIDKLINQQYDTMDSKSGKGELAQLTRLFSKNLTDGLAKLLYQHDSSATNHHKSVSIELAYIDKQPYAKYNKNGKNICGELADVLFVYRDEWNTRNASGIISKCPNPKERALLFQAKVNGNKNLPVVPITKRPSTDKEFKLLSEWPSFNLIKAPRSNVPLLNNVDVTEPNINKLSHGWFGACAPNHKLVWKSRWMCGEAVNGAKCNYSLGEVLEGLYHDKTIKNIQIGRNFKSVKKIDSQNSGWDDLVNKVLKLSKDSKAPSVLSSYNDTRLVSSILQSHIKPTDNKAISDVSFCIEYFFEYSNYNHRFHFFHDELMYWVEDIFVNIKNCREYLQLKKELLELIIWVHDEMIIRNLSFQNSIINGLVKEYLNKNLIDNTLCSGLVGADSNNIYTPKRGGLFILIATISRSENNYE